MFEQRWTDVVAGLAVAAAIGYFFFELDRRQKKLRDLIDVLDQDDIEFTNTLEDMVYSGALQPHGAA